MGIGRKIKGALRNGLQGNPMLDMGIGMLAASGYSETPRTLGEIFAAGALNAQGRTQTRNENAFLQRQMEMEELKAAQQLHDMEMRQYLMNYFSGGGGALRRGLGGAPIAPTRVVGEDPAASAGPAPLIGQGGEVLEDEQPLPEDYQQQPSGTGYGGYSGGYGGSQSDSLALLAMMDPEKALAWALNEPERETNRRLKEISAQQAAATNEIALAAAAREERLAKKEDQEQDWITQSTHSDYVRGVKDLSQVVNLFEELEDGPFRAGGGDFLGLRVPVAQALAYLEKSKAAGTLNDEEYKRGLYKVERLKSLMAPYSIERIATSLAPAAKQGRITQPKFQLAQDSGMSYEHNQGATNIFQAAQIMDTYLDAIEYDLKVGRNVDSAVDMDWVNKQRGVVDKALAIADKYVYGDDSGYYGDASTGNAQSGERKEPNAAQRLGQRILGLSEEDIDYDRLKQEGF